MNGLSFFPAAEFHIQAQLLVILPRHWQKRDRSRQILLRQRDQFLLLRKIFDERVANLSPFTRTAYKMHDPEEEIAQAVAASSGLEKMVSIGSSFAARCRICVR